MSNQKLSVAQIIGLLIVGGLIAFLIWYVVEHYRLDTPFPVKIKHLTDQRPHYK